MAELVQRHMESMADEIQEMLRTKLYTPEETSLILKKRKEFEYRINGVSKTLKDFTDYITYEKALVKQIRIRRDKHRMPDRKGGIEYKILKRMRTLYEIALQRFSSNLKLCTDYIKFCGQSNFSDVATRTIQNMTKNFSQDPEVWQLAASWYASNKNDINTALKILNKGLTIHKNNKLLYKEAIKLELSIIKENKEDLEEIQKQACRRIETYLQFIHEHINDHEFLIKILNLLESYSFTRNVQNLIVDKLLQNYADVAFVWHTVAQREKRGLHHGVNNDEVKESNEKSLSLCFAKYQEGLGMVSPSEKSDLWAMYLDCLVEAHCESNELPNSVKIELLKTALEQASNDKYLPERYYIKWLEFANDKEALVILERGTTALPDSIDLWKLYLRYAITIQKNNQVNLVFERGTEMLKERSLPLWFMCLRYYSLISRDDIVEEIYQKGITQPPEISTTLKPRYIEWLALSKGIAETRKRYTSLAKKKPFCKELHVTMSKIESMEVEHDYNTWTDVHRTACKQFGEEDVDVWINYVLFYLHFDRSENVNELVQDVYREAENTLSPLLKADFREKYSRTIAEQLLT